MVDRPIGSLPVLLVSILLIGSGATVFASGKSEIVDLTCRGATANLKPVSLLGLTADVQDMFDDGHNTVTVCVSVKNPGSKSRRTVAEVELAPRPVGTQGARAAIGFSIVHVFEEIKPAIGPWRVSDRSPIAMVPIPSNLRTVDGIVAFITTGVLKSDPASAGYRVVL